MSRGRVGAGVDRTRVIGGRYVVLGELARGATGVVWRAEDRVLGREVAVQELTLPGMQSPEQRRSFRERLLRAARVAGRIEHPGVVTVHDVVTDGDVDHLVVELVQAPTLADEVAATGPLGESAATDLARQLAAALRAIHAADVVHGGVAPHNVVLATGGRARLTGLAIADALDGLRLERAPELLAPELLEGGAASAESDMWALGVTLHVALLGRSPFAQGTPEATTAAVLHDEVPGAVTRGPLGGVLAGLLQRDPQARLTALQVVAQLDAPGGRPSARGSAADRRRRWWPLATAALGLVAGLGAGLALAGGGDPEVATFFHGRAGDVALLAPIQDACLRDDLQTGPVDAPDLVSCAEPHALEVFETLDPWGQRDVPYPGTEAVRRFAALACTGAFEAAVAPEQRRGLEVVALVPSEAAFPLDGTGDRSGRRDVHCLLRSADGGPLPGTRVGGKPG